MSIEVAILDLLRADPLIESHLHDAYYPGTSGQDAASPYLAYHLLDEEEGYTLKAPDGTPRARLQLEVWATDPDIRRRVGFAVKENLNGFQGWAGPVYAKRIKASFAGDDEEQSEAGYWYRRRIIVEADYDQQPPPRNQAAANVVYPTVFAASAQNHSGITQFFTDTLDGLAPGDFVTLFGFTTYNGRHLVVDVDDDPNVFECGQAFVAIEQGFWTH